MHGRGTIKQLLLPIAVLASLWPATLLVQAATAENTAAPRADAAVVRLGHGSSLTALEAGQRKLANEVEFAFADTPAPDIASSAGALRAEALAWYQNHHDGSAEALSVASAMRSLDDAIAALALSPSPGRRAAFEATLASYNDSIATPSLI